MPRYRLVIEYDGAAFCGWQTQKTGKSVQDAICDALFAYCQERPLLYAAGRTDKGVHAMAQCAHFDLEQDKDPHQLRAAVNFHLRGQTIAILSAEKTGADFHARFSAEKRHYIYLIINRPAQPILMAGRAWHIAQNLDDQAIDQMKQTAQFLTGTHDWTSFRAAACQAASPVKTLDALCVERQDNIITIRAQARSFLYHQIRSLAGALVFAGLGKMTPDEIRQILKARDRALCPPLAPPWGLYLARIDYPPPYALNQNDIKQDREIQT